MNCLFKGTQLRKFLITDITALNYHTDYYYNEICTTGMNKNDFK